jgi:hypothetical protein
MIHLHGTRSADGTVESDEDLIRPRSRTLQRLPVFLFAMSMLSNLSAARVANNALVSKPDTFASWPQFQECLPLRYCRFKTI